MSSSVEKTFIKSAITPEQEIREDLAAELGDRRAYLLIGAALTVAVQRRFPTEASVSDIQEFVAALSDRFPQTTDEFDAKATESVIRGVRGEVELLDEVDPDYMIDMSFLVTYAIMSKDADTDAARDEFADAAVALAGDD